MKRIIATLIALVFAFAVSAAGFAAEKPAEAPKAEKAAPAPKAEAKKAEPATTEKKAKTKKATGEVVKVSVDEGIIVVKGKKGEDVYDIKDVKWKEYKDGKEVKAGDIVVIGYVDMDGKKAAKTVGKSHAKKAKAEPKKAEPAPAAKPVEPAKK